MREPICSIFAAICLIATVLVPQLPKIAHCEPSQKVEDEDPIQNVLKSEDASDFGNSVAQLLTKASRKQLQGYKAHSHNSIALHAAWEQVKRSTSITRAELLQLKDKDRTSPILKIDRAALRQFIGFVEGRLQISPPKWWLAKLRRSKTYWDSDSYLWFPRIDSFYFMGKRVEPYVKNTGQVHALDELDLALLANGGLKVTSGKLSCTIPARFLQAAKKRYGPTVGDFGPKTWMNDAGLTVWMDADRCVFGFHGPLATGFTLHCIDRKTSAIIWSTDVWGYFWGGSGTGFAHWVEIRKHGDTLFLFGIDTTRFVYIEGHSMRDGANLFHFTTSYMSDE